MTSFISEVCGLMRNRISVSKVCSINFIDKPIKLVKVRTAVLFKDHFEIVIIVTSYKITKSIRTPPKELDSGHKVEVVVFPE